MADSIAGAAEEAEDAPRTVTKRRVRWTTSQVGESCATPRLAAPAAPAAPAPVSLALNLPSPFLAVGDSHAGARACQVERLAKLPPAEVVYSNLVSQMLPGSVLRVPNPAAHLVALLGHHSSGGDADGGGGGERE